MRLGFTARSAGGRLMAWSPTDPSPVLAEPSRSRFRLPHWGWFVLATVALVVAGIGLSVWLPWHREQQAIRMIESWGGGNLDIRPVAPEWVRQVLGEDRMTEFKVFDRLISVEFSDPETLTDAKIVHLRSLTNLQYLCLARASLTDTGLAHLNGLTRLGVLSLRRTAVTDSGLHNLNGLNNLYSLDLGETAVSGAGLADLNGLPSLFDLELDRTAVTDAGLVHLSGLRGLQQLRLDETAVTDAGLAHLRECKNLGILNLKGTAVTDEGVQELKNALPDCEIAH